MQLKTSSCKFFDKTFFLKNFKRCWPIWAGYLFFMTWLIPGVIYFDNSLGFMFDLETREKRMIMSIFDDGLQASMWLSVFAGILLAMTVFSYLQNDRACNLIHSLPLTRVDLYSTGLISGMIFMIVPDLFVFGLMNIIAGKFSLNCFAQLLQWLLLTVLMNLFFYSLGILCMMFVGNIVASAFGYAIMILFADLVITPLNQIARTMYYGMSNQLIRIPDDSWLMILMPGRFFSNIDYYSIQNEAGITVSYKLTNLSMIVFMSLLASIVFIVLTLWFYGERHSEAAGDMVAINFLRPVFRWVFAIVIALLMSWLLLDSVFSGNEFLKARPVIAVVLIILFSVIAHIIAEMIIRKSFRVFKGFWGKLGIFTAIITAVIVVFALVGKNAALRVVAPDDCESAWIEINGHYLSGKNDVNETKEDIYDIHRYIVDHYDEIQDDILSRQYTNSIRISLGNSGINGKNREISREYMIPNTQRELFGMIEKFANRNVKGFMLNYYDNPDYKLVGARIYTNYTGTDNSSGQVSAADAKKLIEALDKDIEAGTFTFERAIGWNYGELFGDAKSTDTMEPVEYEVNGGINIDWKAPDKYEYCTIDFEYSYKSDVFNYLYTSYDSIWFDENCENLIDAVLNVELQAFDK